MNKMEKRKGKGVKRKEKWIIKESEWRGKKEKWNYKGERMEGKKEKWNYKGKWRENGIKERELEKMY